jgi:hypothetical protein
VLLVAGQGVAPQSIDASVLGGELVEAVVHVAAGVLGRGGANDPLQAREISVGGAPRWDEINP